MEEVDEIVVHTLRQIGCDIEEGVNSLREFNTDIIIEGVVRCIKLITPSLELSHNVPPGMSARYRLSSTLAAECSELGYKGEIGYQTFLYSNETELRKVFLFLIEKLPKESEKTFDQPLDKLALLMRECGSYCKECLNTPWLPYYCKAGPITSGQFFVENSHLSVPYCTKHVSLPFDNKGEIEPTRTLRLKYFECILLLRNQISPYSNLACSIYEDNERAYVTENRSEWDRDKLVKGDLKSLKEENRKKALELLAQAVLHKVSSDVRKGEVLPLSLSEDAKFKGSRFSHALELQFTAPEKEKTISDVHVSPEKGLSTEEDRQKLREKEISEIQMKLDEVTGSIEQLSVQSKRLGSSVQQIADMINTESEKVNAMKESYRMKKCTLSLLPDAEKNVEKLEVLIDTSSQRLLSLASQWEEHRVPLIEEYRNLKEASSQRLSETQRRVEEIKQMHDKIRDTGTEASHKEEVYKQLIAAYEKMTKDLNRSAYTKRILEIVANIKKQKAEIDKVLLDTRNVQKEINRLSGKLERTFTVTDELIFRDAKKDEAVRRAYKLLAALHENCSQLVQITEETGITVREIREIEDHIEQENQKKVVATLERIMSDYKQMQQENASLIAQLK